MEQRNHLIELRKNNQKRLYVLESRAALLGFNTPPEVIIEAEEIRSKIEELDIRISLVDKSLVVVLNETIPIPSTDQLVRIVFEGQFSNLDNNRLDIIVKALAAIVDVMPEQISVQRALSGSVILFFEMPALSALTLRRLLITDDALLKEMGIKAIDFNEIMFKGHYTDKVQWLFNEFPDLTPSIFSGDFLNINFERIDLSQSVFTGQFYEVNLAKSILNDAIISGLFFRSSLKEASFVNANLDNAVFVRVDFSGADFKNSTIRKVDFRNVSLSNAKNLTIEQLQEVSRLRGSIMPNGELYTGQFSLPGDIQDATNLGYFLDEPQQLQHFYRKEEVA